MARDDSSLAMTPVRAWRDADAQVYADISKARDTTVIYFRFDTEFTTEDLAKVDREEVKAIVADMGGMLVDRISRHLAPGLA